MIKLALFYFLEHVLFGKEGKNLIDMEWVALVDNLEAFNKYPLGGGDLLWDDTIWFAKSFGEPSIQTLIVSTLMLPSSFSGSGE